MYVRVVVVTAFALAGLGFLLLTSTVVRRRPPVGGPSGVGIVGTPGGPEGEPPPAPTIAPPVPDSPAVQVNRRIFLNRAWLLAMTVFGAAFGGGFVGFMWPNKLSGFGSVITAGKKADILASIKNDKRPYYNPEGRFYIVTYPHADKGNVYVKEGLVRDGLMALYQKCAHLGCRVPFCESAQWFECPCHGSKYNTAGEVQPGSPAPAGLWRFPLSFDGDNIMVDTSKPSGQPPKGTDTLREPPAGPHCV
jgi:cytochrome b6-f complex iron-sulfur subunit